jgi:hypothetical protein
MMAPGKHRSFPEPSDGWLGSLGRAHHRWQHEGGVCATVPVKDRVGRGLGGKIVGVQLHSLLTPAFEAWLPGRTLTQGPGQALVSDNTGLCSSS